LGAPHRSLRGQELDFAPFEAGKQHIPLLKPERLADRGRDDHPAIRPEPNLYGRHVVVQERRLWRFGHAGSGFPHLVPLENVTDLLVTDTKSSRDIGTFHAPRCERADFRRSRGEMLHGGA